MGKCPCCKKKIKKLELEKREYNSFTVFLEDVTSCSLTEIQSKDQRQVEHDDAYFCPKCGEKVADNEDYAMELLE